MAWGYASRGQFARISGVLTCIAVVAASACSAPDEADERSGTKSDPVVWTDNLSTPNDLLQPEVENDQRREVFEEQDGFRHGDPEVPGYAWLRSFAQESGIALVEAADDEGQPTDRLTQRQPFNPRLLKYPDHLKHGKVKNLCAGQRYAEQPAPAFCSATLIDDDLILTAAHCAFDIDAPLHENVRAVFNHYNIANDAMADIECDTPAGQICESRDVFRVRPILVGDHGADSSEDFAIFQLVDANGNSKPATPRYRPAPVRTNGTPSDLGTPIVKVGSPSGLPLKMSISKRVQGREGVAQFDDKTYLSFIDVFRGDSGGGIYDARTFELVALVKGGPNFRINNVGTSFVPRLPDKACNIAGLCPMSAARRAELEAAGVTVLCQDSQGDVFPEILVRVDVALAHLCGVGTGVPPRISPPPGFTSRRLCGRQTNETCATAERFDLKLNHEITLTGDTTAFSHDANTSCGSTGASPDAFYRFEVPPGKPVFFWADTMGPGNTFDTVLFLQQGCPASQEITCDDDTPVCPAEGGPGARKSLFGETLDPGTYYLGISGFDGASGRYSIHVQSIEVSDDGIQLDSSQLGTPLFIEGDTNTSASSGSENLCGRPGAKDFIVLYATCPDSVGGPVFASTCDPLTSFDTVLSFEQGSRPFTRCHDDMLVSGCFRASNIGFENLTRANSGSGVRALYVDGFSPADSGRFGLNVTLPP